MIFGRLGRVPSVKVSVQAEPRGLESWLALARRLESSGFEALLMGDHPGTGASPWPALGAAAAVTESLKLGTYVLQTGVRDPVQVASDAATLDVLAPGRVLLGLGAGHTFSEWEATGRERPSRRDRAGRFVEFVDAVRRLLDGESVSLDGRYVQLVDARLEGLPFGPRVRVVVGGGNPGVLRAGAARADVIALSGLGRTLPDGHRHEVRWSAAALAAQLRLIQTETRRYGRAPEVEALVQVVTETADRQHAMIELSERLEGASVGILGGAPFVLIGTIEQMAAQLESQAERLGITRYVVRELAVDVLARVLALLKGGH